MPSVGDGGSFLFCPHMDVYIKIMYNKGSFVFLSSPPFLLKKCSL